MRQALWVSVLLVIALFAAVTTAVAGVPDYINYQGRLTDPMGNPLDTTISITFTIYDDSTGGNPIWTETHESVEVVNGLFTVTPDDGVTIDLEDYYWLGITVGDDPEIDPLTRLTTAPFAAQSRSVSGDITTDSARVIIGDTTGSNIVISSVDEYKIATAAGDSSGFELYAGEDTAGFSFYHETGRGYPHNRGLDYLFAADVGSDLRMAGTGSDGQGVLHATAGGVPNGYDDICLRGNFLSQYGDSAEFALRADENGSSLVLTDPQGDTAVTISSDGTIHATGAIRSGNTLVLNGPNDELLAPGGEMYFGRENPSNTFDPDVKVGVGTTTPTGRLEVYGTTDPARSLLILNHLTTNPTQVLDTVFKIRSDTYGYTFLTVNGGGLIQQFQSGLSPANQFNPSGDSYFNAPGGRLGVGTSTPSSNYALHVEGQDRGLYSIATQGSNTVRPYGVVAGLNTTNSATTGGGLQVSINHGIHAPNISYIMGGDFTLTRGTGSNHLIGTRVQIDGEAAGDYGIQLQVEDPGYAIYSVDDGPSYFEGKVGIGTSAPKAKLHSTTSTIVGAANAPAADSDLGNSQVNVYVDETTNQLCFKVKYSNGTIKTGCIPLF